MARAPRKRSASVRLALMGAAASTVAVTSGCGEDVQRNSYLSRAECVADYSEAQCNPDYPVGSSYGGTHYYGPWYRSNYSGTRSADDPGPGRYFSSRTSGFSSGGSSSVGHAPSGTESGTRGGFGSHGVSARS